VAIDCSARTRPDPHSGRVVVFDPVDPDIGQMWEEQVKTLMITLRP
jgi:hypothetical protein